jgi:adenylate cyclase
VANPNLCTACERELLKRRGGAEVPSSLLFADIRGSTTLAERITPGEYKALLNRFYTTASETVFAHGGIVDKFVGDELVAAYPPFLGENHAQRAVESAQDLFRATGHADPAGPWVPLGAGVHTGTVWFGAIGEGSHVEITTVGDVVNTTARLASLAQAGEILVSADAASAAGLDPGLERRRLELKGKQDATDVVSLRVDGGQAVQKD